MGKYLKLFLKDKNIPLRPFNSNNWKSHIQEIFSTKFQNLTDIYVFQPWNNCLPIIQCRIFIILSSKSLPFLGRYPPFPFPFPPTWWNETEPGWTPPSQPAPVTPPYFSPSDYLTVMVLDRTSNIYLFLKVFMNITKLHLSKIELVVVFFICRAKIPVFSFEDLIQ